MQRTAAIVALILKFFFIGIEASSEEPYVFPVFYADSNCSGGAAVSVSTFISGDNILFQGAVDANGTCSTEAICLIDVESEQCRSLNHTKTGVANHIVSQTGAIQQCDPTNEDVGQDECNLLTECYQSSLFPDCHFFAYLRSDLIADPDILKNTDITKGLDDQGYMIFYKDDSCTQFETLLGIVAGLTTFSTMEGSVSCEDSVFCVLDPEGFACNRLGGANGPNTTIYYENRNNGRDVYQCDKEGNCDAIDSDACLVSTLTPTCHYRWASAKRFFEDPAEFIIYVNKTSDTPAPSSTASTFKGNILTNMILLFSLCILFVVSLF